MTIPFLKRFQTKVFLVVLLISAVFLWIEVEEFGRHPFLGTLLILIIVWQVARWLARPVEQLALQATQVRAGHYDRRLRYFSQDECEQIGRALNRLADQAQSRARAWSHDKTQFETVFSSMTEGVVVVGPEGRVLAVNPVVVRIFEIDTASVQGKMFIEVLRHNELSTLLEKTLDSGKPHTAEVRTFSPDERLFEARVLPLEEEGKSAGALLVLYDVTQLRKLEQVRRDFVANVSHELRTPLASIKGYAETLKDGALKDPVVARDFIVSIEKQANRMSALVNDLLDLAAIESGRRAPRFETFDLNALLAELVHSLQPLARSHQVLLDFKETDFPSTLQADPGQIRQAFSNLIDNAVKFTPENGRVSVGIRAETGGVKVSVTDTGSGIPHQDLPRIFERFYRVDSARSREAGGTGLGLSIVKHIVEAHGGRITAESSVNKGSTFTVVLPTRS